MIRHTGKSSATELEAIVQNLHSQIELLREEVETARAVPVRRRMPTDRESVTHHFRIGEEDGYLIVGLHEDGRPGEVFIKMAKEGSTSGGLMDVVGILTSLALQYGVPIEKLVMKLSHTRFEPAGPTGNPEIPFAASPVDYVFRWLGREFGEGGEIVGREAGIPPEPI